MSSDIILSVENVSKLYRLGTVGTGTFGGDVQRFWKTKILREEDPFMKIGQTNDRTSKNNAEFVWALKDINFEVKRGEVLGIIGKNGAGKSTLLKLLSRITLPTTGKIKSAGRMASLLEVGTGFHPELTGRENIFLNGAILGMTKKEIQSKFDEIIDFSGCELYIDTPTKRYSSGMTVRLGFAVAAHLEPEILVVDEVLAVGDAEFQKKAIGKMQEVSQQGGRTVLFVSHNMASVKSICTAGLILKNGIITYAGTADDAVSRYLKAEIDNAKIPLRARKDRQGNGKLKFVDIKFKNNKGDIVSDVISGDPITIELHYEAIAFIDEKQLIIGLNINDPNQENVIAFVSDEMEMNLQKLNNKGVILLNLANLNIRGETYSIRLLAFERNTALENALDIIDHAAELKVLQGDINKIGRINRKGHSAIQPGLFTNVLQ